MMIEVSEFRLALLCTVLLSGFIFYSCRYLQTLHGFQVCQKLQRVQQVQELQQVPWLQRVQAHHDLPKHRRRG